MFRTKKKPCNTSIQGNELISFDKTLYRIHDQFDIITFEIDRITELLNTIIDYNERSIDSSSFVIGSDKMKTCCNNLGLVESLLLKQKNEMTDCLSFIDEERKKIKNQNHLCIKEIKNDKTYNK